MSDWLLWRSRYFRKRSQAQLPLWKVKGELSILFKTASSFSLPWLLKNLCSPNWCTAGQVQDPTCRHKSLWRAGLKSLDQAGWVTLVKRLLYFRTIPYLHGQWTEALQDNVPIEKGFSREPQGARKYKLLCCWAEPGEAFPAVSPSRHTNKMPLAELCPHSQDSWWEWASHFSLPLWGRTRLSV